jgi:hypothetical protein
LKLIRDRGWLTTPEYRDMHYAGTYLNAHIVCRFDLDRLWELGLVRRFRNPSLSRESGMHPMTWYWAPIPDPGGDDDFGPFTATVEEAMKCK